MRDQLDSSYLDIGSNILELGYLSSNPDQLSDKYFSEGKTAGTASVVLADSTDSTWKDRWGNVMAYDGEDEEYFKLADKDSEIAESYEGIEQKAERIRKNQQNSQNSVLEEKVESTLELVPKDSTAQDYVIDTMRTFYKAGMGDVMMENLDEEVREWAEN